MAKRSSDYHSFLIRKLTDPQIAEAYLNAAIHDSSESFLVALRNVAEAKRMSKVAENAGVSRESLYRTLSSGGNPRFDTLTSVLSALGFGLRLEALAAMSPSATPAGSELLGSSCPPYQVPPDREDTSLKGRHLPIQPACQFESGSSYGAYKHAGHGKLAL